MAKTIQQMTAEIREVNVAKGWRPAEGGPGENTWGDYIALLHSEISEALEAYRDHRLADATKPYDYMDSDTDATRPAKPEGVGSELADVLIRLLDMADVFGVGVSGYERLGDIRHATTWMPVRSFGDQMAWLHAQVTDAWATRERLSIVLRTLLAVAREFEIDLDAEYERKIAYNRTRAFQHGRRTLAGRGPARPMPSPKEDYRALRESSDAVMARVRDGVTAAAIRYGVGSDEHLRWRYAYSGEGEAPAAAEVDPRLLSGGGKTTRFNTLLAAMPTDPCGYWAKHEADDFIMAWRRLNMPELTLGDAEGARLVLRCVDMPYAARLIDFTGNIVDGKGFEIVRGDYVVAVVQDKKKETGNGNS